VPDPCPYARANHIGSDHIGPHHIGPDYGTDKCPYNPKSNYRSDPCAQLPGA
jgi:hypothetical protein